MPKALNILLSGARRIVSLNMNSCAMSSTSPVYIRIPALILSKTPFTIKLVWEPGMYVSRIPRPTAMAIGVLSA